MSTEYSLKVKNESQNTGDFCVYATEPEGNRNNIYSLAWFTKRVKPNTTVTFKWRVDFSFMWTETGILKPGVLFDASETLGTDPSDISINSTVLTHDGGAYAFIEPYAAEHKTSRGNMGIFTDDSIPHGMASIGIGISGNAAFATQATPNYSFTFLPHLKYWITFGDYVEGKVLDLSKKAGNYEIVYNPNVYSRSLVLDTSNKWVNKG